MHSELGNGHVGLLLVSHSHAIAEGVAEMVTQVAGPGVSATAAGGACDGSLGTDGGRILAALQAILAERDAVVLVDIGSSVLAVRAAVSTLPPEDRDRVFMADAPLVEGAVAAGVAAAGGATGQETVRAAEGANGIAKF